MAFVPGLVAALALSAGASVAAYHSDMRDPNVGSALVAPVTTRATPPPAAHKVCKRDLVGDWFYADGRTLKVLCNGKHGQYERTVTR